MRTKITFREWVLMLWGMFLISAAVYYFMLPGHLVLGSLSGLVMVLANFIPLKISTLTLILNVVLLVIGYVLIGKEFGLKTVIASLELPLFLRIFETVTPDMESLSGNVVVDLVCFMVIISIGQAQLFNMNASSGGLDIVAKLLNKYLGFKIGESLTVAGFLIALTSVFVYDKQTVVVSLIGTYIYGIVLDQYCDGFRTRKRICIISEKYAEIQEYILKELRRGATLYHAYGGLDNALHIEVETILEKSEYGKLLAFVQETDPSAFVTVSTVSEVIGEWNRKKRRVF